MRSAALPQIRAFMTGVFLIVLIVAQTTVAKPTVNNLATLERQTAFEMSSSNSGNSGLRFPRAASGNFPLVNAALSINDRVQSGQLSPSAAQAEANRLIQANKYATNLSILNGSLGK